MIERGSPTRDTAVADTIEEVRRERFPDIDRALVLKVLSLHAEGSQTENLDRQVDEAIAEHMAEDA